MAYVGENDLEMWENTDPRDLWVFDKAIVAKKLGYRCGLKGHELPVPDHYIARPISNPLGMSRGAFEFWGAGSTETMLPDGYFWCERFEGPHYSVDYFAAEQKLCVRGYKDRDQPLNRWKLWERVDKKIKLPSICCELLAIKGWINVEFIGDKVIEIHLRPNPDFYHHDAPYIIPAYERTEMENHKFVLTPEQDRIGFFMPEKGADSLIASQEC